LPVLKGGEKMPKGCKVCRADNVKEIDKAIIEGETLQSIADKFHFHISTISRHKPHIASKIRTYSALTEAGEGGCIMQQVSSLLQRAESLLSQAEASQDVKTALMGVRECRSTLELLAKISGELSPDRILIQFAPVIDNLTMIMRQEIHDKPTMQRIAERIGQLDVINI
jgi:hypothetical protein